MKNVKDIIRRPIITEKATWLRDTANKYVFEVEKHCNKIEIKKAVEELFVCQVKQVFIQAVAGTVR